MLLSVSMRLTISQLIFLRFEISLPTIGKFMLGPSAFRANNNYYGLTRRSTFVLLKILLEISSIEERVVSMFGI